MDEVGRKRSAEEVSPSASSTRLPKRTAAHFAAGRKAWSRTKLKLTNPELKQQHSSHGSCFTGECLGLCWLQVEDTKWDEANPTLGNIDFVHLLMEDVFIDKSAALYNLLSSWYNMRMGDFRPTPLLMVYPRRFAKTTLLQFIEAVFSPVPRRKGYHREKTYSKDCIS